MELDAIDEFLQLLLDEHYYVFMAIVVAVAFVWQSKPWRRRHMEEEVDDAAIKSTKTASVQTKKRQILLRGNLRNQLETLQLEKEDLEGLVSQLRIEIETKDVQLSRALAESLTTVTAGTKNKRIGLTRRFAGELGTLGSSWTLLIFGLCFVNSKRQRRSSKRQRHPIRRTIKTAREHSSIVNEYFWRVALPVLSKNSKIVAEEALAYVTSDETVIGVAIAITHERMKDIARRRIVPVVDCISTKLSENAELVVSAIRAVELSEAKKNEASANLIKELEEQLDALRNRLREVQTSGVVMEGELEQLKGALEGKEALLYEERMRTRGWKFQYTELKLKWEQARGKESQKQQEAAWSLVSEDQKRLIRGFLTEHMRSRQHKQELQILGFVNNKKNSFLPAPIQQGIAVAVTMTNRNSDKKDESNFFSSSDLYSDSSMLSEREPFQFGFEQATLSGEDYEIVCRDDTYYGQDSFQNMIQQEEDCRDASNEGGHRVFDRFLERNVSDNNDIRLNEIRERFLQSRNPPTQGTWSVAVPWNSSNFHHQPALPPFLFTANSASKQIDNQGIRRLFRKGNGEMQKRAEAKPSSWTENQTPVGMATSE
mmetsp:Transcript_6670/g.19247  ORF Transcript_6670/g.19247 Transcript_6670/m.19247 type:complete len:599 (+) Transcript_6670:60-1856(+)